MYLFYVYVYSKSSCLPMVFFYLSVLCGVFLFFGQTFVNFLLASLFSFCSKCYGILSSGTVKTMHWKHVSGSWSSCVLLRVYFLGEIGGRVEVEVVVFLLPVVILSCLPFFKVAFSSSNWRMRCWRTLFSLNNLAAMASDSFLARNNSSMRVSLESS